MEYQIYQTQAGNYAVKRDGGDHSFIAKFETMGEAEDFILSVGGSFVRYDEKKTAFEVVYSADDKITTYKFSNYMNKKEARQNEKIEYEQMIKEYTPHANEFVYDHTPPNFNRGTIDPIYTNILPVVNPKYEIYISDYKLSTDEYPIEVSRVIYPYRLESKSKKYGNRFTHIGRNQILQTKPKKVRMKEQNQTVTIYSKIIPSDEEIKKIAMIEFIKNYGF